MGYRHYFYFVDKDLLNSIRNCNSYEELYNLFVKNNITAYDKFDDDDNYYCPLYKLDNGKNFEFGKYYENAEEIMKCGEKLFINKDMQDIYDDDYKPYMCDEKAILSAIEFQKQLIINHYKSLTNPITNNYFDERTHEQRMLSHFQSKLREWESQFIDILDLKTDSCSLTNSWLYEYNIFTLVNLYKTYNKEKEAILFMGW